MNYTQQQQIAALLREANTSPDAHRAQSCMRRAMALASGQSAPDPLGTSYAPPTSQIPFDQVHPPVAADMIQPTMAPSRWLVLQTRPSMAPQTNSAPIRLEFSSGGGWLIGFRATALDRTAGFLSADQFVQASVGVQMFLNDGEELVTNGNAADFISLADMCAPDVQWTPIMRRVRSTDVLTVTFRNLTPAGGNTLEVGGAFGFWRDRYPGA